MRQMKHNGSSGVHSARRGPILKQIFTVFCCVILLAALVFISDAPAVRLSEQGVSYGGRSQNGAQTLLSADEPVPNVPVSEAQNGVPFVSEPTETAPLTQPFAEPSSQSSDLSGAPAVPAPETDADLTADETDAPLYVYEGSSRNESHAPAKAGGKPRTLYIDPSGQYENMLHSATDTVNYEFSVGSRGVLYYALNAASDDSAAWKVRLYQYYYVNGGGEETALRLVNTLNATAKNGRNRAPGIGLIPGRYVISVVNDGTFTPSMFTLSLEFYAGTSFEMEYNDTRTRYTEIFANVPVKGSASNYENGHDTDWYMIRTYSDCAFDILFTHADQKLNTVAFKVYLYDADLHEIYSGNSLLLSTSITSGRVGVPAGTYYIQVQSRVYIDSEYTLTVRRDNGFYEKELNDTLAAATPIMADKPIRGALSGRTSNADRDYYAFTLESPGYVSAYIKNLTPAGSASGNVRRLQVMDAEGRLLFGTLMTDAADEVRTPNIGLAAGTYYLSVDNDDLYLNSDIYEVGFSFTASGSWEREYNGDREHANILAEKANVSGTLSNAETVFDEDWYVFTVDADGTICLRLSHENLGGGNDIFRVTLYSSELEPIGDTMVSYESSDAVSGRFGVTPGTYYARVASGNYQSDARYYLSFEIEK